MNNSQVVASFGSKRDLLFILPFGISFAVMVFECFRFYSQSQWGLDFIIHLIILALINLLLVWVLYGTNYLVSSQQLLNRCGPYRKSIAITDIETITPTIHAISAPALSLDRLRINFKNGTILISPKNKVLFISVLNGLNPKIKSVTNI